MKVHLSFYEKVMGVAVQLKRILQGNFNQTRFTKYLESIQYLPREELKKIQAIKLSEILNHAVNNVSFYKPLKEKFRLSPESVYSDVKNFPVLTKQLLHNSMNDLIDPNTPYLVKMNTGGTSQTQAYVLRDKSSLNFRNDEYFNRLIGVYPGMSKLILSRPESEYILGNKKISSYSKNEISKTYRVSSARFDKEKFDKSLEFFKTKKPKVFLGSSTMLYEFIAALEKVGINKIPGSIVGCSECNITPEYISTFKRVLGARVYDIYGATEVNTVASQCEAGEGLHYSPATHYIEILDEDLNEVGEGESGLIYITSFFHRAMPIIRYQIGDIVTKTNKLCSCGRTFPMIQKIDGRTDERIRTSVGSMLASRDIRNIVSKVDNIVDYQAVQIDVDKINLSLIVKNNELSKDEKKIIINGINEFLNCELHISIDYIEKLPKLPNGKVLRVISLKSSSDG